MKIIYKSAVKARAKRLNQPDMPNKYSNKAVSEDDKYYNLEYVDWVWLNTLWKENKWNKKSAPEQTLRKPSVPAKSVAKSPKSDTWKKTVEEIRSSGNEAWNELLDLKLDLITRLTPCQAKARKKKIIQDWQAWKKKNHYNEAANPVPPVKTAAACNFTQHEV